MLESLNPVFPGSSHVGLHGLQTASDAEIWEFAAEQDFVVVSRDVDFFERSLLTGTPPKVLWLNCGNSSTVFVLNLLLQSAGEITNLGNDPELSCLELVG